MNTYILCQLIARVAARRKSENGVSAYGVERAEKIIMYRTDWTVLLIGGSSGVGKTVVSKQIGLHFGMSWFQVDDLRLAFQRSHATFPEGTEALYFFERTPDVWRKTPEDLCNGLIAIGQVLSPAIEIVIENHMDTVAPIIIEGDGIQPSLFARPPIYDHATYRKVRAVFLIEPEEKVLLANIIARHRGITNQTEAELHTEAQAKWLYGQWLAREARHYGLPVLEVRPWATLVERLIAEIGSGLYH